MLRKCLSGAHIKFAARVGSSSAFTLLHKHIIPIRESALCAEGRGVLRAMQFLGAIISQVLVGGIICLFLLLCTIS